MDWWLLGCTARLSFRSRWIKLPHDDYLETHPPFFFVYLFVWYDSV